MEAAVYWARGGVKNEMAQDLAVFGAPPEIIEAALEDDPRFEIWPENVEFLEFFCRCRTQWNVANNLVIGLSYQSVEALMRIYKIENPADFFNEIQLMEFAALPILNEKAN